MYSYMRLRHLLELVAIEEHLPCCNHAFNLPSAVVEVAVTYGKICPCSLFFQCVNGKRENQVFIGQCFHFARRLLPFVVWCIACSACS